MLVSQQHENMFDKHYMENEFNHENSFDNIDDLNKNFSMNDCLIATINVRSLNANFANLECFLKSLSVTPNIIVCTETWNLPNPYLYSMSDYNIYYNDSRINKSDGVVIYIKKSLDKLSASTDIINGNKFLSVEIGVKTGDVLKVTGIYRSHDMDKMVFIEAVKTYISNNRRYKNHIITGDFNIDFIGTDNNSNELLYNFLDYNFIPYYNCITRPSPLDDGGTCIDNTLVKAQINGIKSYIYTNTFADHFTLLLKLDLLSKNRAMKTPSINFNKLLSNCIEVDWNKLILLQDPDEAINILIQNMQRIINKSYRYPKKKQKKKDNQPRKDWITSGIVNSCKTKEFLYLCWAKDKSNTSLREEYNKYCKVLNRIIKAAKQNFEKNTVSQCKDSRKLWNFVNGKIGRTEKKSCNIESLICDGNKVSDKKQIANNFVDYFSNIGNSLASKIDINKKSLTKTYDRNPYSIFLVPTDKNEIEKIIRELKDKAGGVDGISSKVLKCLASIISKPLEHIFNICMYKGMWPNALKAAEIIPIFKSGDRQLVSNYRPISLISNIAKVFENIMNTRLINFLNKHEIISDKQFGFVKNRGTCDAISFVTEYIYKNLDKNCPTIVVFLDLAKAFDTVNHTIFLNKLEAYGIRGDVLDLLKNYLTNRMQCVKVNNNISESMNVTIGVPQGTILGPLLFILYINDMFNFIPDNSLVSYADDTAILCSGKNWEEVQIKVTEWLEIINSWLCMNQLSMNADKTTFITFGCYLDSVPNELEILINNTKIKRVHHCKYLGIVLDGCMKWDCHIRELIKKVKYFIFVFYKLSLVMNKKNMKIIYHALIESVINYGITAWGGAYSNTLNSLVSIQNKLLKKIGEDSILNVGKCFIVNSILTNYEECRKKFCDIRRNTRNKSVSLPKINKALTCKSSSYIAVKYFNMLPNELKNLVGTKKFIKQKLTKWVLQFDN
jgi:hypothetical protein